MDIFTAYRVNIFSFTGLECGIQYEVVIKPHLDICRPQ